MGVDVSSCSSGNGHFGRLRTGHLDRLRASRFDRLRTGRPYPSVKRI